MYIFPLPGKTFSVGQNKERTDCEAASTAFVCGACAPFLIKGNCRKTREEDEWKLREGQEVHRSQVCFAPP